MKKTIIGILSSVIITFCGGSALAYGTDGDIYDIIPCDSEGNERTPEWCITNSMTSGDVARFIVRFIWPEKDLKGTWQFMWCGVDTPIKDLLMPRLGIFVSRDQSSPCVYAEYVGQVPNSNEAFTDFVFEYTVQAGDFALPIRLAAEGTSGPVPASDRRDGGSIYFLDKGRYNSSAWQLQYIPNDESKERKTANWQASTKWKEERKPSSWPDQWNFWNLSYYDTDAEEFRGFYVKTIDFSSEWEDKANNVWRTVHQGPNGTTDLSLDIESTVATQKKVALYVWSTNDDIVVTGPNLRKAVEMPDPQNPGIGTVKYDVATVVFEAGRTDPVQFFVRGVTQGKSAGIVLCSEPAFSISDSTGDILPNFVSVPMLCTEPEKPTIRATVDGSQKTVYVDADESTYKASITVAMNPDWETRTKPVKVVLTPKFEGTLPAGRSIYDFVRISKDSNPGMVPPAGVITNEVGPYSSNFSKVYVYALGAINTWGSTDHIKFEISITDDDTEAKEHFEGSEGGGLSHCQLSFVAQPPVIESLDEEEGVLKADGGMPLELSIKMSDAYLDRNCTNGYVITVWKNTSQSTTKETLSGRYLPNNKNILVKLDDQGNRTEVYPTVKYMSAGTFDAEVWIKSPVSGETSEPYAVKVNVTAPGEIYFNKTEMTESESEEEEIELQATLSKAVPDGLTYYLFLAPQDDSEDILSYTNRIKGKCFATTNKTGNITSGDGVQITKVGPNTFRFSAIDGDCKGDSIVNLKAVLCTTREYDEKNLVDYASDGFSLKISNTNPELIGVTVKSADGKTDLDSAEESGGKLNRSLSKGCSRLFYLGVVDVAQDLEQEFQTRWRFNGGQWTNIVGNVNTLCWSNQFNVVGTGLKVEIEAMDKDIYAKYSSPTVAWSDRNAGKQKFSFLVDVVDRPEIVITPRASVIYENEDRDSSVLEIPIELTANNANEDVPVFVYVYPKDPQLSDMGIFELKNTKVGTIGVTNVYKVVFSGGSKAAQSLIINADTLDGTLNSYNFGWELSAAVTNIVKDAEGNVLEFKMQTPYPEIRVRNAAPVFDEMSTTMFEGTNEVAASVYNSGIQWMVEDVFPDVTNSIGLTVSLTGATVSNYTFSITNISDLSYGVMHPFKPDFSKDAGKKCLTLTLTVMDKDGAKAVKYYRFKVSAANMLNTRAIGPSMGGTSLYKNKAKNLGAGRIYVDGIEFASANDFDYTWNGGSYKSRTAYAIGYKVGDIDDGNLQKTKYKGGKNYDVGISGDGSTYTGDNPFDYNLYWLATNSVATSNIVMRDSFFYAWVKVITDDSGNATATLYGDTIDPEHADANAAGRSLNWASETDDTDDEDNSAGTYGVFEAVFALEKYPTDNMGDINADGIPDLYYSLYDFTADDETSDSTETGMTYADLNELDTYNDDGDYLPGELNSSITTYTTNLASGVAFKALWEIRGFGSGLNNAPALAGVSKVSPDRIYLDPDNCETSTLSKVEYMAWTEYKAAHPEATEKDWSPECPTDPTKWDTDGDGMPDGFEYYYWYRAHVGYINAKGEHEYLTGRRFDPRNPGKGTVIPRETIVKMMDPRDDAGLNAMQTDTDNDGLVDLLECYLGTSPFDFDTDGDGLPDGWEVMVSGSDPLQEQTYADGKSDALRNNDGDAMAITSPKREKLVTPTQYNIQQITSFAVVDPDGDSDGVQWYVVKAGDESKFTFETNSVKATEFVYGGETFVTLDAIVRADNRLATAITAYKAVTNKIGSATYPDVLCQPTRINAGATIATVGELGEYYQLVLKAVPDASKVDCNAAWIYGNDEASGEYGFLAIGRYKMPKVPEDGLTVCEVPSTEREVCYLHYLVYQQFGFDARTAWKPDGTLASRWQKAGYVSIPTRTRAYAAYDEFLVMSFFLNNGCEMSGYTTADASAPLLARQWLAFTTNPNGPGDVANTESLTYQDGDVSVKYYGLNSINGADTDYDGVPDGWELYVMGGAKEKGKFVFANPYKDATMSPFYSASESQANSTKTDKDDDDLSELREFSGTDSCAYYAEIYTDDNDGILSDATILKRESQDGSLPDTYDTDDTKWLNKFLPTDPWNYDTDGDGIGDGDEGSQESPNAFFYGTPADDGKIWSIPGAGLNPCSVDTDLDGLPDGWEFDFKLSNPTVYSGDDATYLKDEDDNDIGNPLEGYIDCMDGTVPDAYNLVRGLKSTDGSGGITTWYMKTVDGRRWSGHVNRDYDHDGLSNWQEYLVGTMRCWRYDDPFTPFNPITDEDYGTTNGAPLDASVAAKNLKAKGLLASDDVDEFWYETLINKESKIYNPRLVTGMSSGAQYFSRVTNGWDIAYGDGNSYYYFSHRIGDTLISDSWFKTTAIELEHTDDYSDYQGTPSKYISCSPLEYDTDRDGMDDYYELFHGMNPLLGEAGVSVNDSGPYDVIYSNWGATKSMVKAWDNGSANANVWTKRAQGGDYYKTGVKPRGTGYDFEYYPWLNGLATADPDGDDIRNQTEAIMPLMATTTWLHTDPTPLWMTDMSYSNSLTRLYYRMPTRYAEVDLPQSFKHVEKDVTNVYYTCDCDGYEQVEGLGVSYIMKRFVPDQWMLTAKDSYNWMFSFEENEGFDSDHDALSDNEEVEGKYHTASDPQYADSPHRRQAMYFQGPAHPSILQTMPRTKEIYPIARQSYADDPLFLTFTVEAWVNAESLDDSTIIERAIWSAKSNPGDEEYIRKNFLLGIRDGKWYAKYDYGTLLRSMVSVSSKDGATTGWHHIAASYDGTRFNLYIDGGLGGQTTPVESNAQPEYGSSALAFYRAYAAGVPTYNQPGKYWFDNEYQYFAIIIGGSVKCGGADTSEEPGKTYPGRALDLSQGRGFDNYEYFFKGYIDEIRIWDGARDAQDIEDDVTAHKRYTNEDAVANRLEFYKQWAKGEVRYAKNSDGDDYATGTGVVPELRYHYSFDSLPASENAEQVAKAPHGYEVTFGKPYLSRPMGYVVDWWQTILNGYAGTVYSNPAWVPWIPNTVAHLPRYDGTTLDSVFWSTSYCGTNNGTYAFAYTAEPVSKWSQLSLKNDGVEFSDGSYWTTDSREHFVYDMVWGASNDTSRLAQQYQFSGRHLNQVGDDLLPVGGAYVKYCSTMWDDNGASTTSELAGYDGNDNGLPDWWEAYADQNYQVGGKPFEAVNWDTDVEYHGIIMKAHEAFLRDLAKGMYPDKFGTPIAGDQTYYQTADEDGSKIPDWWEDLYKIAGEGGLTDTDNDGLSNYNEYLASEMLPFNLQLNPRASKTDSVTLDSFIKIGKLYLGEMLTDHDQIEDHWERSLEDPENVNANVWDAFKDGDEDGWNNFEEARYNGYCRSTLAQLVSHVMGDVETIDAPMPTIDFTVRYNGNRQTIKGKSLKVLVYSDDDMQKVDASYTITPGTETATKSVYLGGWEDRIVRGTMSPGHIEINTVNLEFIQVLDSTLYSWTDSTGTHISRPYSEFKSALANDSEIIQNVQIADGSSWLSLTAPENDYTSSDKAVTVSRDGTQQLGYINVYGEQVGVINLETGEFEFNMTAINEITPNYTFDSAKGKEAAWGYKEAIFRLTYKAKVPNTQYSKVTMTLGEADTGFVRGGKNCIFAYYAVGGNEYTPGIDPCGVVRDVDIGWYGAKVEMEVSEQNAITPRIKIWEDTSDRVALWGSSNSEGDALDKKANSSVGDYYTWLSVVRSAIDGRSLFDMGAQRVVYSNRYDSFVREFIHEGDFLRNGAFDIDWDYLKDDLVERGIDDMAVTNVTYDIVLGTAPFADNDNLESANVLGTKIERCFETVEGRTAPTALEDGQVCISAKPIFKWRIDGEDAAASRFGTTYTAFRIRVWDASDNEVYDSGYQRMPVCDASGVYSWTAPLCVGCPSPSGSHRVFKNLSNYTWMVYTYNARHRSDNVGSKLMQFRTNVTELDNSTASIKVKVCYAGPAKNLANRIHVQAFEKPDFSGDPIAEGVLTNVSAAALSPTNGSEIVLSGLYSGSYFLKAYIDTDFDCEHDDWESWGYLCERDRGRVGGEKSIFNPVSMTITVGGVTPAARTIFIEDCDTDGDWFPDAWEAEQNGNKFDAYAAGQGPVSGSAELIGVNTNLVKRLDSSSVMKQVLQQLCTSAGVELLSGSSVSALKCSIADGALEFTPNVKSVAISSINLDSENNQLVLGLESDNDSVDAIVSALYVVNVKAPVTIKVYRVATLAEQWGSVPVYTETLDLGDGSGEVRLSLEGVDLKSGFYKVEVEQ